MKKVTVVDWEDFKKQSKSDIAACKLLYDTGDYGNAAYHLQQAVEKHAKAILLHGNLMPKLKTHLPLSEFIGEFVRDLHYFSAIAIKYNIRVFELDASDSRTNQLLNETIIMMSALREGKKSFIDALWKNSLGIPLVDKQEEAVFQRCPKFSKYYKRKIIRVYGYDNVTARDKFMNDAVIKKLGYYKPIVELAPMIAATFPHEEIGRYPTEIRTSKGLENSVELYKNNKSELKKLIEMAEKYLTDR